MSTTATIREVLGTIPRGRPFSRAQLARCGSAASVNRALARLAAKGELVRAVRGIYARPIRSRYSGRALGPAVEDVVRVLARTRGERIQIHGAAAALRFRLSTQVPLFPIYYVSGASRRLLIGQEQVRMVHAPDECVFQYPERMPGLALAALAYVGEEHATGATAEAIMSALSGEDLARLLNADKPPWMESALHKALEHRA